MRTMDAEQKWMEKIKVKRNLIQPLTRTEAKVLEMLRDGKQISDVSRVLHVCFERAEEIRYQIIKKGYDVMAKGAKITDAEIVSICRCVQEGHSDKFISMAINRSMQTVWKIKRKYLKGEYNELLNRANVHEDAPQQALNDSEVKVIPEEHESHTSESEACTEAIAETESVTNELPEIVKQAIEEKIETITAVIEENKETVEYYKKLIEGLKNANGVLALQMGDLMRFMDDYTKDYET